MFKCDLKRHVASVHEGKKPHKCLSCGSSFSEKSKLNIHVAVIHDGKKRGKFREN